MLLALRRHLQPLLLAMGVVVSPGILKSHEIEITADAAQVKVRQEVLATVKRGERYKVVRVQLPWVAISLDGAAGRIGWVPADQVRLVVEPGLDETSPAPDAPSAFRAQADLTQVNGSAIQMVLPGGQVITTHFRGQLPGGPEVKIPASYLAFRLTLRNESEETVAVAAHDFKLRADETEVEGLNADDLARMLAVQGTVDFRGDPSAQSPFPTCQLAPGDTQQGWLCFDLTNLPFSKEFVRMPQADRWLLHAAWGNASLRLDLKANELNALNATTRPSRLDSTVQVVQIGSRLNALNLGGLIAKLAALKDESGVVFLQPPDCQHDQAAQALFQSLQHASSAARPDGKQRFPRLWQVRSQPASATFSGRVRRMGFPQQFYTIGPAANSEPLAVVQVLAQRPQAGSRLIEHLGDESAEIRAASAQGLASHLTEEGVIAALVSAAKDSDAKVRAAGLHALGTAPYALDRYGRPHTGPAPAAQSADPAALAAVQAALHDSEAIVRNAAATAAKAFPPDRIAGDLIPLLDDMDLSVQIAACQSVGQLKSQAAVARLKELAAKADDSPPGPRAPARGASGAAALRSAALDALVALDAMSAVDAAIAKLEAGNPSPQDFALLAEVQDERAVPALIGRVRASFPTLDHQAIQTLGDSGDARAVEPLLEALNLVHPGGDDIVVKALGNLRDRRAIEPLRRRLAKLEHPQMRDGYLAALLLVDDPRAFAEVEALLKAANNRNPFQDGQLLEALGRSGHPKAPDIIEPFLDDPRYCQFAAKAAVASRLPKAYTALATRLESAKYPHGAMVVSALAENRPWALSPHGQAILKSAAQSPNAMTRSAAGGVLRTLQPNTP